MPVSAVPAPVIPNEGRRSSPEQRRTLWMASLSTLLVLITFVTPLGTGIRTAATLQTGLGGQAWLLSSMSVGLAAALLAVGVLADDYGRKGAGGSPPPDGGYPGQNTAEGEQALLSLTTGVVEHGPWFPSAQIPHFRQQQYRDRWSGFVQQHHRHPKHGQWSVHPFCQYCWRWEQCIRF